MPSNHPYADGFAAIAHRGGYGGGVPPALENTIAAFDNARDYGFRYLETDVHATSDGVLVAFHDDILDRVTDTRGAIGALPWASVRRARIGGSEPIPTLGEVLESASGCVVNIDLKSDAAVAPLVATLDAHRAHARVCVGSFDTRRLHRFRLLTGGQVATSVTTLGVATLASPGVRRACMPDGIAVQVPVRTPRGNLPLVTRGFVRASHRAGKVVHVWTINEASEMERLIDLGVDGLVSDDLATLRGVLRARGLWEGGDE